MDTNSTEWNMGRLMELATGYWPSAVLSAAVDLGVFDQLSNAPATIEQLAKSCGADPRFLQEICATLAALRLLEQNGDAYALASGAEALLNRNSPTCILDALRFNIDMYPLWGRLADCARKGAPALPPGAHLGMDPERTRRFALGMHSRALALAPSFLHALNLGDARSLLDVASGPGTFSRMLAARHPDLAVTQFDLPAILDVAKELTQNDPAQSRIAFHAGDYHRDPLPPGAFDAALLCGAIHQEDDAFACDLFGRVKRALRPDGRFYIVDMMLEADRVGPVFSNLFSINMMLTSPAGRVFTAERLTTLLRDAGFAQIELTKPERSPYWVLEAR